MKRLLTISFDIALLSFIPILSWFALSVIIDNNLINVFTLTYPLQFVWLFLKSIFSTGANISREKDKNKNAVMSALLMGSIIGIAIFTMIIIHIDSYITFMNMDVSIYRNFAIYSVAQLCVQLIFAFIVNKLYFEEKVYEANKYTIIFNLLNFITLITSALIFKDQMLIIIITLLSISIYTIYVLFKTADKFKFKLNIINCIRYNSINILKSIFYFITFLFGLSIAMDFGVEYTLAITFVALITDIQWDAFDAITVVSQIDISKKKFNYYEHLKTAYALLLILLATSGAMFLIFYWFYDLNLWITLSFFLIEIISFLLFPLYEMKLTYLQIQYDSIIPEANTAINAGSRTALSFLPTPYCTAIGQLFSSIYQTITVNIIFNKNFYICKNGQVRKRPSRNKTA